MTTICKTKMAQLCLSAQFFFLVFLFSKLFTLENWQWCADLIWTRTFNFAMIFFLLHNSIETNTIFLRKEEGKYINKNFIFGRMNICCAIHGKYVDWQQACRKKSACVCVSVWMSIRNNSSSKRRSANIMVLECREPRMTKKKEICELDAKESIVQIFWKGRRNGKWTKN